MPNPVAILAIQEALSRCQLEIDVLNKDITLLQQHIADKQARLATVQSRQTSLNQAITTLGV